MNGLPQSVGLWMILPAQRDRFEAQPRIARQAYNELCQRKWPSRKAKLRRLPVYALAETKREPLLFKSEDFSPTDVTIALA